MTSVEEVVVIASVCVSVCQRHNSKSCRRNFSEIFGRMGQLVRFVVIQIAMRIQKF